MCFDNTNAQVLSHHCKILRNRTLASLKSGSILASACTTPWLSIKSTLTSINMLLRLEILIKRDDYTNNYLMEKDRDCPRTKVMLMPTKWLVEKGNLTTRSPARPQFHRHDPQMLSNLRHQIFMRPKEPKDAAARRSRVAIRKTRRTWRHRRWRAD